MERSPDPMGLWVGTWGVEATATRAPDPKPDKAPLPQASTPAVPQTETESPAAR